MSNQTNLLNEEDIIKIREYITKNYEPREEDREEDELMQKMEELEEKGFNFGNGGTMSMAVNVPVQDKVFLTINEMAKYLGIGHNRIRRLVKDNPDANYILLRGTRVYLKREMFVETMLKLSRL